MASSRPTKTCNPSFAQNPSGTFIKTAQLQKSLLECCICRENFDQDLHCPKRLPCDHIICFMCVTMITKEAEHTLRNRRTILQCPFCRECHSLTQQEVFQLPNDRTTIQLIDFLSTADEQQGRFCQYHPQHRLRFFCKPCQLPACRVCRAILHKEEEGHEVIKTLQAWRETLENVTPTVKFLEDRKQSNSVCMRNLRICKTRHTDHINDTFATYQAVLDKKKAELLSEFETMIQRRYSEAMQQNECITRSIATFKKLCADVQGAESNMWQPDIFSNRMNEWNASVKNIGNIADIDLCGYNFTAPGEEPLMNFLGHFTVHEMKKSIPTAGNFTSRGPPPPVPPKRAKSMSSLYLPA